MTSEASLSLDPRQESASASPAAAAMIRIENLSYDYSGRMALDGISLQVARGEMLGLLGPNGSGKSTLLRILAGLRRPAGGRAAVDDQDVATHPAAVRHRLGVAFQSPSLDNKLSVEENIRFQGYLFGLSGRALSVRVEGMLERFGLVERRRERVETLSGGLKRRVELAKALLHSPPVLLLDEPSSGLDPAARREFWLVLGEMREAEQLTVIVATHLMDEADRCDRVALLDRGRLAALDTPAALKAGLGGDTVTLESARPDALAEKIASRLGLKAAIAGETVRLEGTDGMALARKVMEAFPDEVRAVRVGKPTLEDVFIALTGRKLESEEQSP
jgi:ABC-2 type transport system ATP-binding protein